MRLTLISALIKSQLDQANSPCTEPCNRTVAEKAVPDRSEQATLRDGKPARGQMQSAWAAIKVR